MMLEPASSSGEKSATAQITVLPSKLLSVCLMPPASGTATIKIYDSAAASTSGTVLYEAQVASGGLSLNEFTCAIIANQGLYAVLTGTTTYVIGFQLY